ncbi:glycine cleavage system aminomethyltransferase GcvT [Silvanigrella paludirubra]|jgi:aminomethyltransferase|uniref:Aminomethyltransferase n=1 Tax=Silvanigrella paludirubra TaxID=2499159 RepID=A0A6N6VT47_9BACT|nr:glycine cleavage system aminomethyltransferase GcvT [Silvanigrella paludirubra]KAB8038726.1 glycine cleavage system aminomethyltransferase GcvT [Silvanigrella paludirubra]
MSINEKLKITPLYDEHVALGARMVPFAGWNMPVQYSGVVEEHKCVRNQVGLFDVSHMGEINVTGRGALDFLQMMTVNDVSKIIIGQAQYNAFCYENGTIVDDIIIYRRGYDSFFICVNASNIEKDYSWLKEHAPKQGVILENLSDDYAQIAVQGPKSRELVSKVVDVKIADLAYYHFAEGKVLGVPSIIARTGYTGELGYELYIPSSAAPKIWKALMQAGSDYGIKACGLGARDTLRLECGYLLYGNDMDHTTTALECGLSWITKFEKNTFIGKEVLLNQKEKGLNKRLVAFEMQEKAIGRHGYKIYSSKDGEQEIGIITSGSPSPTLTKNIGMAYVTTDYSKIGSSIWIEVRGEKKLAMVVKKPFFVHGSVQG